MYLRKLELKDAPFMLEWMHDGNVIGNLRTDFASKTIQDAEGFIEWSSNDKKNLNLAIASDEDEYMGTVSLKHIDNESAEFAITVRQKAMGKGYAKYGMEEIMKIAADDYGIKYVYWCVNPDNRRAIRFYEKNNFKRIKWNHINIGGGVQQRANSKLLLVYVSAINLKMNIGLPRPFAYM